MSTDTITFIALAPKQFVPVINGFAVVKAPSIKGHSLVGDSPWAVLATDDERAAGKTAKRLKTGRWAAAVKLTRNGNLPKKPKFDRDSLAAARTERKAELDAASAERKAAEAQAKAEAKAAKAAKAEAKTQVTKPAADGANLAMIRFAKDREAAADMIASGMTVDEVAGMYGVDAGMVERITNLVFASVLDDEDEVEVSAADVAAA